MLSPSYNYSFIFVFSLLILSKLQNYPNVITVCFYITYISIYNLREDTNLNTIKQKITQIIENLISLRHSLRVSLPTSLSPYVSLYVREFFCVRESVYSIKRSVYLMLFIPHVLQKKTLDVYAVYVLCERISFLCKLYKFYASLNRYWHCAT